MKDKILGDVEMFEGGGIASKEEYSFDQVDAEAMLAMAGVMYETSKTGRPKGNWRKLPIEVILNHALIHIYKYMAGDRGEDHLARVMCRAFMAWAVAKNPQKSIDIPTGIRPSCNSFTSPLKVRGRDEEEREVELEFTPEKKSEGGEDMEYVYICAPLNGNKSPIKENVERVIRAIHMLREEWRKEGRMPLVLCPHTAFHGISFDFSGEDREWGMAMCLEMAKLCDRMIVLGGEITNGMQIEMKIMKNRGKPITIRRDL